MALIGEKLLKKIKKNDHFMQLKENVIYGQQLSHTGSWTHDLQTDEIFFSDEVYHILGCTPEEFDGKLEKFYLYIHPDDLETVKEATKGALVGKEYDIEYRIVTPDGIQKYVREKTKALLDKGNNPIKIVGIIQDITEYKLIENDLKAIGENLNQAQTVAGVGSWKYDVIKDEIFWSEEVYRIYKVDPLDFKKGFNNLLELIHPEDRPKMQNAVKNCLKGKRYQIEYRIPQEDGTEKYVLTKGEPLFNKEQQVVGILGTLQDITENKEAQKKIEEAQKEISMIQRRFQVLVQESGDVFEIITVDGRIEYVSPAVEKILGCKPEERIGKSIFEYYRGENLQNLREMVELVLKDPGKTIQRDIVSKNKEDQEIFLEVHMSNQLSEPSVQGIVINFRDITKRVEMEKRIAHIATHDELTHLPNRIYFRKYLKLQFETAIENQTSFALMILNIDDFKYINNALGYQSGDELIIEISKRLKSFLGEDRFICRYSGVQFVIVVQGLHSIKEYEKIAKGMIDIFSQPFRMDKYELYITVNIGISIYPEDGQNSDSLQKHANIALIRAKDEKKNSYKFYSANMNILSYKQFELRNDLRKAIEHEQLRVYYQPQINLQTSEILAAEALIRWEHPTWGMVPPIEFIALAEETGLIVNMGKWMLREVCRNYKQWLEAGLPSIKISINYSSIQFFEKNFVEHVKNIIDEFKLDPHFLIIEITESILIKESEQIISNIKSLQALGIQVALDDFGTGYSSLAYLNSLNIDIIKIDRSFIQNVLLDETSTIITTNVIELARKLRIKLVAEGIETWEQLSYLRKLNCYTGQGYLYSKPVSREDFERILIRKKCKPIRVNDLKTEVREERRKYFRIQFPQLLEADMTILKIMGKKAKVGNTKVLIKNMGPGGLCFVSNIRLPIKKDVILQFTTELLEKEIKVYGCSIWTEELDDHLYEYGMEFTFDEYEQKELIKILHQIQIKMRNNMGFTEGSFVPDSIPQYFR